MEALATLLDAVATLLWPIMVIAIILAFRPAVASIIESARSRKFTLKIGGQELTMEEANAQQRNLIADIQAQIVELRGRLEGEHVLPEVGPPAPAAPPRQPSAILWVDDHPKNNSYFIEQLEKAGVRVDLALSTREGLAKLAARPYSAVISDMGRREDGEQNTDAGVDLLRAMREKGMDTRVFFFCSVRGVREHRDDAIQLGAAGITSSATELFGLLNLQELAKT